MADVSQNLAVARLNAGDFLNALVLVHKDGSTLEIPAEAKDNRLKSQLVVASLRDLLAEQAGLYRKAGGVMSATTLKDFIAANAKCEEMGRFAYSDLLTSEEGGMTNSPAAFVKANAEGMTAAFIKHSADDRMKRITELGKKKEPLKSVEIVAE